MAVVRGASPRENGNQSIRRVIGGVIDVRAHRRQVGPDRRGADEAPSDLAPLVGQHIPRMGGDQFGAAGAMDLPSGDSLSICASVSSSSPAALAASMALPTAISG